MWLIVLYCRLFVVVHFPRNLWRFNTFSTVLSRATLPASNLLMRRILSLAIFCTVVSSQLLAQENAPAQPLGSAASDQAYGEKLRIAGIHNAGKINDGLYRGAQPKQAGLEELKKLGVTTIVDLRRDNPQKVDWERREAAALGMRFVYIPVSGWAPPSDEQVAEFLGLFREDPKPKVFVHCRFGDDRTGIFVATYRMAVDQWTPSQAIGEMYFFGFNGFWHPSMKKFVRGFPEHRRSSQALSPPPG
jgi:tyrosine-protein phosphatase SIW14